MLIRVKRLNDDGVSTIGNLYINSKLACFTLEDSHHDIKILGKTRIPAGFYSIELRKEGGMHQRYLKKFPDMHRGMIWIKNVPGFTYVYLHIGNDEDDTLGCVLVGNELVSNVNRDGKLHDSTTCYKTIYPLIAAAIEKEGEPTGILLEDN